MPSSCTADTKCGSCRRPAAGLLRWPRNSSRHPAAPASSHAALNDGERIRPEPAVRSLHDSASGSRGGSPSVQTDPARAEIRKGNFRILGIGVYLSFRPANNDEPTLAARVMNPTGLHDSSAHHLTRSVRRRRSKASRQRAAPDCHCACGQVFSARRAELDQRTRLTLLLLPSVHEWCGQDRSRVVLRLSAARDDRQS